MTIVDGDQKNRGSVVRYNKEAVQREIDKDKAIGSKEAKLIHALLKGWRKE